jgi:hypothetical protein
MLALTLLLNILEEISIDALCGWRVFTSTTSFAVLDVIAEGCDEQC